MPCLFCHHQFLQAETVFTPAPHEHLGSKPSGQVQCCQECVAKLTPPCMQVSLMFTNMHYIRGRSASTASSILSRDGDTAVTIQVITTCMSFLHTANMVPMNDVRWKDWRCPDTNEDATVLTSLIRSYCWTWPRLSEPAMISSTCHSSTCLSCSAAWWLRCMLTSAPRCILWHRISPLQCTIC